MNLDLPSDQNEKVLRRNALFDDYCMFLCWLFFEEREDARQDLTVLAQLAEDGIQVTGPEEVSLHPLFIILSLLMESVVSRVA